MHDWQRVVRAAATNLFAGAAPTLYLRLTAQTGRGRRETESADAIARYFERCFADYLDRLGVAAAEAHRYFAGKTIVEYGPGDFPGVAALCVAHGARKVYCVDRFPMIGFGAKNLEVLESLAEVLNPIARKRIHAALVDQARPALGFRSEVIEYVVRPHGFSDLCDAADFVISRAVLEHVDDLEGTFADMRRAMKPGAVALHQVDLKSHGLHRSNPLDFLEWSPRLWSLMYSHKGVPNRWRVDRYRDIVDRLEVRNVRIEPIEYAERQHVDAVRPLLAKPFRNVEATDLSCLGIWLQFEKPAA